MGLKRIFPVHQVLSLKIFKKSLPCGGRGEILARLEKKTAHFGPGWGWGGEGGGWGCGDLAAEC